MVGKISELFENFINNPGYNAECVADLMGSQAGQLVKCSNKFEFIDKLLFDDEFYQRWGEDCCEELTYIERYNIWIGNNYETGVEYIPEIVPDFDNDYYEPTPKRKLREMKNELIGRTLDLDLGSTPVNMTIKEITETKVIVEYNRSTPGRTEEFSVSDFEYLSGLKIK